MIEAVMEMEPSAACRMGVAKIQYPKTQRDNKIQKELVMGHHWDLPRLPLL